ncbi:hypothetical protein KDU71_15395 [Carboxylicivirga sediminis]|uniref:Uncharacterized protein n=1 Tax=Carboxylicivirga sediminis TaxID=2006564 RepID=A0A941F5W6_9BACT|nr:hypothetical protein [Carboxylicivirga sediminis]MBR8536957.1 hypothetical protein [Carboxylicivirga sediminis]
MRNYFTFELHLLTTWRTAINFIILFILFLFLSLLQLWSGSNDHLSDSTLAQHIGKRAMTSTLTGLFFTLFIIQMVSHLTNSGYYRSLLSFGLSRPKLFLHCQFQITFYLLLILFINYIAASIAGIFFDIRPWQLVLHLNFNSFTAHCLFLFALGNIGLLIGFFRPGNIMVLPFLFYWLIESWLVGYANKGMDTTLFSYTPLAGLKLIIGDTILSTTSLIIISFYVCSTLLILHQSILKKSF